ncbi:hypothetical protein [Phenylobacterium sp.]|uniref:hypothetical protein n=1 Tax=Phenylobacterium sp. TaxID=1871053 RepID=UPI00286CD1DE|nr:hypothetical protein [Phenylobacterium sp.]
MEITSQNQAYLLGLFDISGSGGLGGGMSVPAKPVAPTPPWNAPTTAAQTSAAVTAALAGHKLIDENAAKLDLAGASADYRKLFALYQGLGTLTAIAGQASAKSILPIDKTRLDATFAAGLSEVAAYVASAGFDKLRVSDGVVSGLEKTQVSVPKPSTSYVTPPLTSAIGSEVPAFLGNVKFIISVKRVGTTFNVPIDLSALGAQPRTLSNVIAYANSQLAATGVETRLVAQRIPGQPRSFQSGGKSITLPPSADEWALKVAVGTSETVGFSAPASAGAVYVAQGIGDPDPDHNPLTADGRTQNQLVKFQTDTVAVDAPPQIPGQANFVDGRVFAHTLGPEVKTIRATKVGADGSVYVLADITGATAGQSIKGAQDVALLKYDTAGKLIYSRTLGASNTATGLGLAVSADGQVAVAGALKGALSGAAEGALNSGATGSYAAYSDSFVTLYDANGQEQWTERRGAKLDDEASQVAFGADGTVYVAGRARSVMPGAGALAGGYDSYIEAFKTNATTGKPTSLFTNTFGSAGDDKPAGLVVDGTSLVTAGVESGHAVLRRFDISSGVPVQSSVRDLGDLQGGDIVGLALDAGQVVVAGSTANGSLSAGTVTRAKSGGVDAFAARIDASLSVSAGDAVAYYGGAGNDRATSLAVSGGQVWIGGQAGSDLPGQAPVGKKDGFLASLDVAAGTIGWSRRFTGKDGMASPTAIAVDPVGASVLDRIGLPSGTLNLADSQRLTAQSSLRAGDQFSVKASDGVAKTITIDEAETYDTLAQKIRRASGFEAKVTVTTDLNGERQLSIAPLNSRMTIQLDAGKAGQDALEPLGLKAGVIRETTLINGLSAPADGKGMLYGLGLAAPLNFSDAVQTQHALSQVSSAMGIVRSAYRDLVAAATPKSALPAAQANKASGPVPQYLINQIANYQAALARLTGGG